MGWGPLEWGLLVGSFLALWAGTTLILSQLPWFRPRPSLTERLAPFLRPGWVDDVEDSVHDQQR